MKLKQSSPILVHQYPAGLTTKPHFGTPFFRKKTETTDLWRLNHEEIKPTSNGHNRMCVHEGKKLTNGYRSKLVLRKILRKEKWCKIPFFIVPFDTHSRLLTEFFPSWTTILLWPYVVAFFSSWTVHTMGWEEVSSIYIFFLFFLLLQAACCSRQLQMDMEDLEKKKLPETQLDCKEVMLIHFPKISKIWQLTSCLIWSSNFPQYW